MDDFINNVINTWGDSGAIWLDNLDSVIEKLSAQWGLTDILAIPNLTYNFVAEAKQNNKVVILKVSHDSILQEYSVLNYNNKRGMISVLNADNDSNALLLEKAHPGLSLKKRLDLTVLNKMAIYSEVVNKIASIPLSDNQSFSHISELCSILINPQADIIPKKLSAKASILVEYLLKSARDEYLCHGDLHLDNILENNDTWLAIDPKGIVAEKEFEVAAFNILSDEELDKKVNLSKKIMVRNHSLATQFGFSPQRLLAWIFIKTMLSAKWHIEDNGSPAKSIFIAEQIYPLLKLDY